MRTVIPVIVICAYVLVTSGTSVRDAESLHNANCVNPNQESGRCVLVQECTTILATLRKEILTHSDVAFLYESECGKLGRKSLVCCPNSSIRHENASTGESTSFGTANRVDSPVEGSSYPESNLLPRPGECGTQPSYQLFGENVTKLDEQPWTVLVHLGNLPYETTFECGGALISSRYVLTAAHCVHDTQKWRNLTVRLGEWDTESTVDCITIENYTEFYCADPALDVRVEKVILHEQYFQQHLPQLNDIALLRLAVPVETTPWIRPVCLPEQSLAVKRSEQIFTLAGWGNNGCGNVSRFKIRSKLEPLDREQCRINFRKGFRRVDDYLCTVPVNEGEKCQR